MAKKPDDMSFEEIRETMMDWREKGALNLQKGGVENNEGLLRIALGTVLARGAEWIEAYLALRGGNK